DPPAQEAAHRGGPQAGLARGVSQALFPAWRPRAAEAERLQPLVRALRDQFRARGLGPRSLRRPDQWHVTLCFLGHGERATPALLGAGRHRTAAGTGTGNAALGGALPTRPRRAMLPVRP